jgi:hypothetical protein
MRPRASMYCTARQATASSAIASARAGSLVGGAGQLGAESELEHGTRQEVEESEQRRQQGAHDHERAAAFAVSD